MKRTYDLFYHDYGTFPELNSETDNLWQTIKLKSEYGDVMKKVNEEKKKKKEELLKLPINPANVIDRSDKINSSRTLAVTAGTTKTMIEQENAELIASDHSEDNTIRALLPARASVMTKSKWHAPWKLYRVISGHTGW
ncbi:unnamed protein product, partial [Onchocerca ochengi]|uniref:Uncharacterized protein n=1 Tax=Onchocerca ochengi TaxID=42157 RepID=A0A182EG48_ONCOC